MPAYVIRRVPRMRNIRIAIKRDGSVCVSAPVRVSTREVERVVQEKSAWIERTVETILTRRAALPEDLTADSYAHYLRYKERARLVVERKVKKWNAQFGFSITRISVKRHATRWGSCSSKRNLNFNYKLLFLEETLQDYVVIHELAHLAHLNHSPAFWSLVASACPDYAGCRRTLRSCAM